MIFALFWSFEQDEIQEFATNCILNPPGPRKLKHLNGHRKAPKQRATAASTENGLAVKRKRQNGKQEYKASNGNAKVPSSNRKPKIQLVNNQNGTNGYHTNHRLATTSNDSDDSMVQIDYENLIPSTNGTGEQLHSTKNNVVGMNGSSQSLRQKVKYVAADQGFVHIKPPPINTEKIYVQPNGINQLFGDTLDIPMIHNKLITVKQKESNDRMATALAYKSDEDTSELTSNTTDDNVDANIDNLNIFDIPILFADNDGNIVDNQNGNGIGNHSDSSTNNNSNRSESAKTIEILSEEIITDSIIGKYICLLWFDLFSKAPS